MFLIQLLPEIVDKMTRVVSENLSVEKLTIMDNGDGNGLPNLMKNLTGSVVSFIEGIKGVTGLDLQDIIQRGVKKQDIKMGLRG